MAMKGNELYQLFIEMTGLDHGTVELELRAHLKRLNMNPETLNTNDIRKLMALYLNEFNTDFSSAPNSTAESMTKSALSDQEESLIRNSPKAEA